jgi:hypothetical protein
MFGGRRVNLRIFGAAALLAVCTGTAASAASPRTLSLDSAVYVEKLEGGVRSLEPATRLSRGDRVVTVLSWQRLGNRAGAGHFTLINPLPRAIAYQASGRDSEEVSVDGGRTWGRIGMLRIGERLASPEDVTHVRWQVPVAEANGRITYSGIVR